MHHDIIVNELIIFMMWIGLWGITETIINRYIGYNNYTLRIIIFAIIFGIALLMIRYNH